ncbi:hypothetical protein HU200_016736 [Digitaria exilis]|uniref:Disease resistance R13L4/SHOC-2-like LRR domain-containing protein n=1 Tax=Digitaria exilis TaxID=1010633 RepID=A0A835F7R1_9POAL|nr:hypothetical protein HU200_016736 [Digitaria exilis]
MERDLVKSLKTPRKLQYLQLEIVFPGIDDTTDASPWTSQVSWEAEGFGLPRQLRHLLLGCIIFSRMPSWINSSCLPNLSHLCMHVVSMDEQDLKVIGKMPELRDLLLPTSSTVTISNIANCGYFQKLRSFSMLCSMVQFRQNEDYSISFHMWNGEDAMPFGHKKDSEHRVSPTIMPGLEFLELFFFVRTLNDSSADCIDIGLECLTALQKVTVRIGCQDASVSEVEEAEAALRHFEDNMILASDHH